MERQNCTWELSGFWLCCPVTICGFISGNRFSIEIIFLFVLSLHAVVRTENCVAYVFLTHRPPDDTHRQREKIFTKRNTKKMIHFSVLGFQYADFMVHFFGIQNIWRVIIQKRRNIISINKSISLFIFIQWGLMWN